ncbi:unnamed protein product [Diamesa hyperborea]
MNFPVILLLVGSCIASSFALHCYNCDTKNDASCAKEGYNNVSITCTKHNSTDQFSAPTAVCLKEQIVENGVLRTIRSCAYESRQLPACSLIQRIDYCSTCEKDLCNSSDRKINNLILTFVPVLVLVALKLF